MIGRLFGETWAEIDLAGQTAVGKGRRGEDVVDPPAKPALYRGGNPVIEEGVVARLPWMKPTEQVFDSPRPDGGEGLPDLRCKTDVAEKVFGIVDVDIFRGDVEIAAPDQWLRRGPAVVKEIPQSPEPFELVGEMGRFLLPSLGDIGIDDGDTRKDGGDQAVFIRRTAVRKTVQNGFRGFPGGDCDAVVLPRPPEDHMVTFVGECGNGK